MEYSRENIKQRLRKTKRDYKEFKFEILQRIAYEFGVNLDLYSSKNSDNEIIEITFNNQTSPSKSEEEIIEETKACLDLVA